MLCGVVCVCVCVPVRAALACMGACVLCPDLYLHSQCCASGLIVLVHPVEGDTGL